MSHSGALFHTIFVEI